MIIYFINKFISKIKSSYELLQSYHFEVINDKAHYLDKHFKSKGQIFL